MSIRAVVTRIRHAILGRPLSHEEAQARHDAQVATGRGAAAAENRSRATSVQTQTYTF